MHESARSRQVAIIGAGPGGLASAMLLAREGVPVTLFEREPVVGGRTRTVHAPGGYKFDIGPTFFLYPRVLKDIFEACGERLEDHVELRRLDPQYHLVFEGGGSIRATYDLDRLEQEIARLAPDDARNVRRFLDDNREKLEAFRPVLEQALHKRTRFYLATPFTRIPIWRRTTPSLTPAPAHPHSSNLARLCQRCCERKRASAIMLSWTTLSRRVTLLGAVASMTYRLVDLFRSEPCPR